MPVGIDAVLVPGHITRILWVLAENQCTVDQEIVAEDRLDGVHYGVVGGQPVSPTEEQVRTLSSLFSWPPLWSSISSRAAR